MEERKMRKVAILGFVFAGSVALAQGPPPPPPEGDFAPQRKNRADQAQGRGRLDPARMLKMFAGARGGEVEIAAQGDSVYVVMGSSIFRVAAKTMNVAARGTLEEPEADAAQDTEMRERRMKMMDKDGDGQVSRDEFPKPEMFDRADRNGDGFITLDEVMGRQSVTRKPGGPVKIIAGRSAVYVLRGNVLYKLDPDNLTVTGSTKLDPPEAEKRKRGKERAKRPAGEFDRGARPGGGDFEF